MACGIRVSEVGGWLVGCRRERVNVGAMVDAGTDHSATVGPEGVECLEASR